MAMLEVRDLRKSFYTYAKPGLQAGIFHKPGARKVVSQLDVLKGVDLTVNKGDVVAILGPSGSGKTTFLRCLNFLETTDSGTLIFDGEQFDLGKITKADIARLRKKTAFVDSYPRQLSGGQQQRVAIARALATDPEILYFDEPTSALDPELTGEVLAVMRQLAEEGMTMLVVTHEMGFARNVSSKTVFMENGVVVEQAPSRQFFADPKEERTREFLRKIAHTE